MHSSLLLVVSSVRCFVQILVVFCTGGALAIMLLAHLVVFCTGDALAIMLLAHYSMEQWCIQVC